MELSILSYVRELVAIASSVLGVIYLWDKFSADNKEKWVNRAKSVAFKLMVLLIIGLASMSIIMFVIKDNAPTRLEIFNFVLSFFAVIIWTYIWADDRQLVLRAKKSEVTDAINSTSA